MATIGRLLTPMRAGAGGCLGVHPEAWFEGAYPCGGNKLTIDLNGYGGTRNISVNFAGRGKVGNLCGGSDIYITFTGGYKADIDVWAAYRASVWTSSTTILVYARDASGAPVGSTRTYAGASGFNMVTKATVGDVPNVCPTTLQATVTVNDNGSISIA